MLDAGNRQVARLFLSIVLLGLSGCFKDEGVVDPRAPESLPLLARYQGRPYNENDTALSAGRLLNLRQPRIALVWQFVGPKEFTWTPSEGSVDANPPYAFTLEIRDPPADAILQSPDLAIGTFWLYSDENGNGVLDRLIHPEMLKIHAQVDSIYSIYTRALDSLKRVSVNRSHREDVTETYYIGTYGSVVRNSGQRFDTIWVAKGPADLEIRYWEGVVKHRFRVLNDPDRWERFFALRKRDNDYYAIFKSAEGFAHQMEYPLARKLFPMPGAEIEFEKRLRVATLASVDFQLAYAKLSSSAIANNWQEYPYDGYGKGVDWVAGRSRYFYVLYFRNRASLDELMRAEKSSSFRVVGKEKLSTGYNLISCDEQYECIVRHPSDSVRIDLGQTEAYFNPPPSATRLPVSSPRAVAVASTRLAELQGRYYFQPFRPISILLWEGELWASIPDLGTYRLLSADSSHFFTMAKDIQLQFIDDTTGTHKLLLYASGKRFVATFESGQDIPDQDRLRTIADERTSRARVTADVLERYAGAYDYAGDTLQVLAGVGGDSLRISVPGMLPHHYFARDDSTFASPHCDCLITFEYGQAGSVARAIFVRDGTRISAPGYGYAPSTLLSRFKGAMPVLDSVVSSSDGSGEDLYVGLDGKPRFPPTADSRFLKSGDGWVESLDCSLNGETVTLSRGGEGIGFRVRGLEGKTMQLDLLLRKAASAKGGRILIRLLGGSRQDRLAVMVDDFWLALEADSARISLKPIPVEADPYFLRIEQVRTADASFPYAYDWYRMLIPSVGDAGPQ